MFRCRSKLKRPIFDRESGWLIAIVLLVSSTAAQAQNPPLFTERMVPIARVPKNYTVMKDVFLASPDSSRVAVRISRNFTTDVEHIMLIDNIIWNHTSRVMFGPTFSSDSQGVAGVYSMGGQGFLRYKHPGIWGPDPVAAPIYSPDGKRVAYLGRKGRMRVVFVDDRPSMVHYDEIPADSLAFSPDSRHFVFLARRGSAWFVVLNGQESMPFTQVEKPVFSSNGQRFAYWAMDDSGSWVVVVDGHKNELYRTHKQAGLWFSTDSSKLVAFVNQNNRWYTMVDGQFGIDHDALGHGSLTFSADSQHMAYAARDEGKWKLIVDGFTIGEFDAILAGSLQFSPDSSNLAYVARDAQGWFVVANNHRHQSFNQIYAQSLQFSPDSRRFAYVARNDLEKVNVVVDGYRWAVCDQIQSLNFSPDSASVVWVARNGQLSRVVIDGVEGGYTFDRLVPGASLVFDDTNHLHTVVYQRPGPVFFRYEAQLYPDSQPEYPSLSTTEPSTLESIKP